MTATDKPTVAQMIDALTNDICFVEDMVQSPWVPQTIKDDFRRKADMSRAILDHLSSPAPSGRPMRSAEATAPYLAEKAFDYLKLHDKKSIAAFYDAICAIQSDALQSVAFAIQETDRQAQAVMDRCREKRTVTTTTRNGIKVAARITLLVLIASLFNSVFSFGVACWFSWWTGWLLGALEMANEEA
jgi:hypothetical protein